MVWKQENTQGNESRKIRWEIVEHTRGRGLDVGCSNYKPFGHFIGVDSGKDIQLFGHTMKPDIWAEAIRMTPDRPAYQFNEAEALYYAGDPGAAIAKMQALLAKCKDEKVLSAVAMLKGLLVDVGLKEERGAFAKMKRRF